jgi:EAL domain-containing protein (putative c-di-GMP-specific phosphodiesterase class I)
LDDFGTGYSSLNQLHRLPIDRLKIDRSFTQALNDPNGSLPIVESIVTMAHRMGVQVVAEGVETRDQMWTLCGVECDMLQGYLFSRPVTACAAADLLRAGAEKQLTQRSEEETREPEWAAV